MRKWLFPILALLSFSLESVFVQLLPTDFFEMERIIVPRFVMVILVIITMFSGVSTSMIYGVLLGLFYDIMYTNLIGVYMFAFALLVYGVSIIKKILHINTFTVTIVCLFAITLLDFFVYGIQLLITATTMSVEDFLSVRLFPTLILNLAWVILLFAPLKTHFFAILDTNKNE